MMKSFMHSPSRRRAFLEKCHEGFEIAQDEIARLLPPAERDLPRVRKLYLREIQKYKKRKEPPLPQYTRAGKTFYAASFKSMVLREIANCIAWQILGVDGTQVTGASKQRAAPKPHRRFFSLKGEGGPPFILGGSPVIWQQITGVAFFGRPAQA